MAAALAAAVVPACTGTDKRRVIGDSCIKDDECQAGRCDEHVCKPKNPRGPGEECSHPLECRSQTCLQTLGGRYCGPGVQPKGTQCTDDLQCAPEPEPCRGEPVGQVRCVGGVCVVGTDAGVPDGDIKVAQGHCRSICDSIATICPAAAQEMPPGLDACVDRCMYGDEPAGQLQPLDYLACMAAAQNCDDLGTCKSKY